MSIDEESLNELQSADGVIEGAALVREYAFRLEAIPDVPLTVTIWYDVGRRDSYRFELSHYVKSPEQAGPYVPSGPWYATEAIALRRGIAAITHWVEQGIRDGHTPSAAWLRPATT